MVVVVLTAGGALIALRAYNRAEPARRDTIIKSIKQQAGVMAAICSAIFGVISALQGLKVNIGVSRGDGESTTVAGVQFGKRLSEREAA